MYQQRRKGGSFFVVLNSVNASFDLQENQNFAHLSEHSVWGPFSIGGGASDSKSVAFTIDRSQSGFSFAVTYKESEASEIKGGISPFSTLSYPWNNASGCYEISAGGGVVA